MIGFFVVASKRVFSYPEHMCIIERNLVLSFGFVFGLFRANGKAVTSFDRLWAMKTGMWRATCGGTARRERVMLRLADSTTDQEVAGLDVLREITGLTL